MSDIIYQPITDLDPMQIAAAGSDLFHAVRDPATQDLLNNRHLWGVAEYYGTSQDAAVARLVEANTAAEEGKMHVFVGMDSQTNQALGLANTLPGLALWKQRLNIPAGFTRNRLLGKLIFPADNDLTNVAAWLPSIHTKTGGSNNRILGLQAGYEVLQTLPDRHRQWTIEPLSSSQFIHDAIRAAGFVGTKRGHFDDIEGNRRAPLSSLYEAYTLKA